MSKRAEIAQANAKIPESVMSYTKEHTVLAGLVYREGIKFGYEQAEKDLIALAQQWADSGDANVISFEKFIKLEEER